MTLQLGHYIDGDWDLQSLTLEFTPANGAHAGSDIAKIFRNFLEEYQLQTKVQGMTLDNAASNTKFIAEFKLLMDQDGIEFDAENQHFRCIAHIENLAVQDFLKELRLQNDDEIEPDYEIEEDEIIVEEAENKNHSPIGKLKKLFIKLKYSEQLRHKLQCSCITTNTRMMAPSNDVKTRWHSTDDMIAKALRMQKAINLLCISNPNLQSYCLDKDDWILLTAAHKHLKHFKYVSKALSGEKYATLPLAVVAFNLLLDKIDDAIQELDYKRDVTLNDLKIKNALYAAQAKLLKHYRKCNWVYCAILILDPRHKIEVFDFTEWGKKMKAESVKKFEEIYREKYYVASQESVQIKVSVKQLSENESSEDEIDLHQHYRNGSSKTKYQGAVRGRKKTQADWRKEIEEYTMSDRAHENADILLWWKNHQSIYPNLSRMARDFLSIQATSVPVERLFSRSSLLIRKHRNRLKKDIARELLCINDWTTRKMYSTFKCIQSSS